MRSAASVATSSWWSPTGSRSPPGPELIAERLLEAFKEPFKLSGAEETRVFVKASIGIATGGRSSAEELLRDADIAMYRAKWGGKNRYLVFESGMQDEVQSRMEIEMDLQGALENEEFFLVYQPTFDLESMTPTGVEALIRWRRPGRGVVQPEDFIPLLEESGMIVDVGAWVLKEACAQGAKWRDGRPLARHGGQRLRAPARHRRSSRARRRSAELERARAQRADHRDHRDDADAQRRGNRPQARLPQGPRRPHRRR